VKGPMPEMATLLSACPAFFFMLARHPCPDNRWARRFRERMPPEVSTMSRRAAGKFENPAEAGENTLFDVLRWQFQRFRKKIPGPEAYRFPLAANNPAFLAANRAATTFTWIGHATVLLQLAGRNILTDPHFSERAFPVQWAGPKRVVEPGLALEDLPPLDCVLITHDHYDSLDRTTIERLLQRAKGTGILFLVPLGMGKLLRSWGARQVVELDWWQEHAVGGLAVTAIPMQHWSKRGLGGKDQRLWAGWVVAAPGFRFCFIGDTGYDEALFREIGRRCGPFDLAAVPIGAYEPRWFMAKYHVNPEEAVMIHREIGARKSIAIHWGTFILTDEPLDEPPARLAEAARNAGLAADEFTVLRHGETVVLAGDRDEKAPG
jgi:N-acyl-phosphatidylethanolamine-hydrolysing phospholipase D